ncbi:MAG: CoA pyrophosphatase [Polyangiaceae bacterium]|nr:CoA pyrophosphatase [Polyangiaceae bacterium]
MSPFVDVDLLARRLRARPARRVFRWLPARRAAVAILFDAAGRVLLMQRAARAGDRWSSHVSLPGGMQHPDDASPAATAARETLEEVGVDLAASEPLGALDELRAVANASLRPMAIAPFVYRARAPVAPVAGAETAHVFWLPLERAARGELDDRVPFPVLGLHIRFPCWRFDGQIVWGLTLGILRRVIELARPGA